ncbi:MAG: dienelactone hydrolase family protein [Ferruginibacter sp.]
MKFLFFSLAVLFCFTACNNNMKPKATEMEAKKIPVIIAEPVTYTGDSITMNGFVAYDSALQGKLPVVMIIHEWWGLNDYTKSRAKQLAELGYLAMAVDLYGNGINGNNPEEATKLATPFYTNPLTAQKRFDAALEKIKTFPQADTNKIAAIGYCFGGSMVLNLAALGENLKAVVSFHAGLRTVPAEKNTLKAKILVCHGAADKFITPEEIAKFRQNLDSIGVQYTFKAYDSALHAFTNPEATEIGKKFNIAVAYNAAADSASWKDMKAFFEQYLH